MDSSYFIAIIPPLDISSKIENFKQFCYENYHSKGAFNAPAHITLVMPFTLPDKKIVSLLQLLDDFSQQFNGFDVKLHNFGFFEPRVVFVNVMESDLLSSIQKELLYTLKSKLNLDIGDYKDRGFHPHMTIAFRDLKKPMFYEAKKYFEAQKYEASFFNTRLVLLKKEDKIWQICNEIKLKSAD